MWAYLLGLLLKLPLSSKTFWQWAIESVLLALAIIIALARGFTLVEVGLIAYIFAGRRIINAVLDFALPEATK